MSSIRHHILLEYCTRFAHKLQPHFANLGGSCLRRAQLHPREQPLHHLDAEHQQILAVQRLIPKRQRHRRRGVERQPLVKPVQRGEELLAVHLRVERKPHVDAPVRLIHPVDAQLGAHRLEVGHRDKVRHAERLVAEAIDQLLLNVVALRGRRDGGDAPY